MATTLDPTASSQNRNTLHAVSGQMDLDLNVTAHAIHHAKHLLMTGVRMWGLDELAPDVGLVMSELLTNVLQHAVSPDGSPVDRARCVVLRVPTGVVIVVHDGDPTPPREQPASDSGLNGRGLTIVRRLAASVVVTPSPVGGKDITVQLEQLCSDRSGISAA
ncbi:ATP-binding protein [Streptomyces xanthophaeus]|uniref:ATP-binding protein n=1 Tax=Streptomyces xanthophaeus TaxID=67385 RepID=UPI0036CBCF44